MIKSTCRLLGGWFAVFIQISLGFLCVGTLVVKRQTENPRREWLVWFMDAMKQGFGSSFGHFSNIYLSVIIANRISGGDECQWYCLAFVMDSIFGTIFNILLLSILESLLKRYHQSCFFLKFGEYGNPPKLAYFLPQLLLWMCIVIVSKISVLIILAEFYGPLDRVMTYLFESIRSYPELELVFVMIVVPVIFNTMQFWIQDTFLKRQHVRFVHTPLLQTDLDEDLIGKVGDFCFSVSSPCDKTPLSSMS